MAALKIINDNGTIVLVDGPFGHALGDSLAEARQTLRQAMQEIRRGDLLRAVGRRLIASGIDPETASLAQVKNAIEGAEVDV